MYNNKHSIYNLFNTFTFLFNDSASRLFSKYSKTVLGIHVKSTTPYHTVCSHVLYTYKHSMLPANWRSETWQTQLYCLIYKVQIRQHRWNQYTIIKQLQSYIKHIYHSTSVPKLFNVEQLYKIILTYIYM